MALSTYANRRGGRQARKTNADRQKADRLKSDGVLHNDETLANQVYAEAINCPVCHKRVYPSNFNQHMNNDHPGGKPLHEVTERLPLAAIRTDGGTQPRAAINAETIREYAEAIQDGAQFPALVVYYDGKDYWLADGYHRYHAAKQCGLLDFPADVRQGTVRDAILHSVGANATHGLRRTNQDKRRAVERLLRDDEWAKWSDREIARRCGVSHNFVSEQRKSLPANQSKVTFPSSSLSSDDSEKREYTTKHGTQATMQVGRIGKSTPSPASDNPSLTLPASGAGTGSSSPDDDGQVFVDARSGAVTYSTEVDTYIEDEGDSYVEDVPSVEVETSPDPSWGDDIGGRHIGGRYASGEEEYRLGGRGATVVMRSGQHGTLAFVSGRVAYVDTQNGRRQYNVQHVNPEINPSLTLPASGAGTVTSFDYKRDAKQMYPADETVSQPFDFCQTPPYALDPLVKYLGWGHGWTIWEPATGEGGLVEGLYDSGWMEGDVIASDILTGQNFFDWQPDRFDVIVTNPPYSLKFKWLERCYALGKPFALLLPVETLGAKTAQALMQEHGFEVMLLDGRVDFKMPNKGWDGAGSQFPVMWLTWQLLPQQMMFGSISDGKKAWNDDHK